jgi:hypothetical protein
MTRPTPISSYFSTPAQAPKSVPRLAISLDALDKCGKTHWSLFTPPDPIALVVANDNIHVYQKAIQAGRRVHLMQLEYPVPDPAILAASQVDKGEHAAQIKEWLRFKSGMDAVKADKAIRTVVWDTATELWHLAELAHFGKLRGNARIDVRTELNADFSKVFWSLYKDRPDLNIILIHRAKKQYEPELDAGGNKMKDKQGNDKTEWNGKYERAGYNNIGFAVDLSLQAGWDGNKRSFWTRIDPGQATRYGTELTGKTWYGDDSGFANLALEIFPETESNPEWWGL